MLIKDTIGGIVGYSENSIPKHIEHKRGLLPPEYVGGVQDTEVLALPKIVNGSKDWLILPSEREIQKTNFIDIMDCTTEAPMNGTHIFLGLLNGWNAPLNGSPVFPTKNLSQRFTAKMSGTTPNGNTTANVDTSICRDGILDESFWHRTPDMDWNAYYAEIPTSVRLQAKKSLNSWQYTTYIISPTQQMMMDALDRGLLLVCGYAWALGDDGLYHDFGYAADHRFVIAGYVKGVKWVARDSYPKDLEIDPNDTDEEFFKELSWDFHFSEVKVMILAPVQDKGNSLLALLYRIINFFLNTTSMMLKKWIMLSNGAIFLVKKNKAGVLSKQEIKTVEDVKVAIVAEFGCQVISTADGAKIPDTTEFMTNK
jgi:hypothetical protein